MLVHGNARLSPRGRRGMVALIEHGVPFRQAAGASGVSVATAHRWWQRWQAASEQERASGSCLGDRSSRPHCSPRRSSSVIEAKVCECREQTGWSPRAIADATGVAHQTVWRILQRFGLSRRPRAAKDAVLRYEWPCPGDLLHMDVCEYARFAQPGHAVTGDRSVRTPGAGTEHAHAIIDDHSRVAYAELHDDATADSVLVFMRGAIRFYAEHGIQIRRVMTDNAWAYTKSSDFRKLLAEHQIKHLTTKPYRPQTNGKIERFHQTMGREWAYGMAYASSSARATALPHWIEHYNQQRTHSAVGAPPITRVHNLPRHDT